MTLGVLALRRLNEHRAKLKRMIRRYNALSIVRTAVNHLHHPSICDPAKWEDGLIRQYQPWNLLLIIKWSFLSGQFSNALPDITEQGFVDIVNHVANFGKFEDIKKFKPLRLFFKNLAFQQFWFQRRVTPAAFARPTMLFAVTNANRFDVEFQHETGLSLDDFFELSVWLFSYFAKHAHHARITLDYFRPGFAIYGRHTIERFLQSLSLPLSQVRTILLESRDAVSHPLLEIYEQTPLRRYPLLRDQGGYVCYSPSVLNEALLSYVYETLRARDSNKFGQRFGPVFEEYVADTLSLLKRPFFREADLKSMVAETTKTVDFAIPYSDATVLIEAKGIELTPLARISPDPGVIARSLKNSALKAVTQAIETANALCAPRSIHAVDVGAHPIYALIVTYKRLYLGTARDLIEGLQNDERLKLVGSVQSRHLPLSHIYFACIDDLEHAVSLETQDVITVAQSLKKAVEDDAAQKTMLFEFGQHLALPPKGVATDFLNDRFSALFDRVRSRLEAAEHGNPP